MAAPPTTAAPVGFDDAETEALMTRLAAAMTAAPAAAPAAAPKPAAAPPAPKSAVQDVGAAAGAGGGAAAGAGGGRPRSSPKTSPRGLNKDLQNLDELVLELEAYRDIFLRNRNAKSTAMNPLARKTELNAEKVTEILGKYPGITEDVKNKLVERYITNPLKFDDINTTVKLTDFKKFYKVDFKPQNDYSFLEDSNFNKYDDSLILYIDTEENIKEKKGLFGELSKYKIPKAFGIPTTVDGIAFNQIPDMNYLPFNYLYKLISNGRYKNVYYIGTYEPNTIKLSTRLGSSPEDSKEVSSLKELVKWLEDYSKINLLFPSESFAEKFGYNGRERGLKWI
jgi:hypothetical protein